MYTNLIVSHWQMMWEVGQLNEKHLRVLARELFAGENGRRFWSLMGDVRLEVEGDRKTRRFHLVMAEEYEQALRDGPPVKSQDDPEALLPPSAVPSSPPDAAPSPSRAATVAVSAGAGALVGACVAMLVRTKGRRAS